MEAAGKKFLFFTNNSSKSPEDYIRKLEKMDCRISRDQIVTSGDVTIRYLKECYGVAKYYEAAWQRMRYLASGEQELAKEAEAGMEAAAEEMGELQPVRERIDGILNYHQ